MGVAPLASQKLVGVVLEGHSQTLIHAHLFAVMGKELPPSNATMETATTMTVAPRHARKRLDGYAQVDQRPAGILVSQYVEMVLGFLPKVAMMET